ncbi:protein grindelwald [Tribolium madens]|uniref:protein grindelwald n=1 Tax=Tribolium madens TaxID=41895 RepID=UPI001CF72486|nr:protein grindelwald [Tribolium madens]
MKKCSEIVILLFIISYSFTFVQSDITLGEISCGQKKCKRDQFCNYANDCEPCSKICDKSTHNFDQPECLKKCQDYIHDSRYVQKENNGNGDQNLRATVQQLSHMVTVTLTLVCLMLVILASVLIFQMYRWKKKKNITLTTIKNKLFSKKADSVQNKSTPASNQVKNEKPDLRLEISPESTHSGHSPVTVTTSISRRPAEDSTLDYAYDNPAMSSSPNKKNDPNNSF